jgi:hypothetical protein
VTLTTQQTTDCRRYMGYSISGNTASYNYREPVYSDITLEAMSLDFRLANLAPTEENTLVNYYLAQLYQREADIQAAAANLTASVAGPYKHNPQEIADRRDLFRALRLELCAWLGFAPGESLMSTNRMVRG